MSKHPFCPASRRKEGTGPWISPRMNGYVTHTRELPCVRPTGRRCVRYRVADLLGFIRRRTQPERVPGAKA